MFIKLKQNQNTAVHAISAHQPKLVSELKPLCHLCTERHSVHTSHMYTLRLGIMSVLFSALSVFSTLKMLHKYLLMEDTRPTSTQFKNGKGVTRLVEMSKEYPLLTKEQT